MCLIDTYLTAIIIPPSPTSRHSPHSIICLMEKEYRIPRKKLPPSSTQTYPSDVSIEQNSAPPNVNNVYTVRNNRLELECPTNISSYINGKPTNVIANTKETRAHNDANYNNRTVQVARKTLETGGCSNIPRTTATRPVYASPFQPTKRKAANQNVKNSTSYTSKKPRLAEDRGPKPLTPQLSVYDVLRYRDRPVNNSTSHASKTQASTPQTKVDVLWHKARPVQNSTSHVSKKPRFTKDSGPQSSTPQSQQPVTTACIPNRAPMFWPAGLRSKPLPENMQSVQKPTARPDIEDKAIVDSERSMPTLILKERANVPLEDHVMPSTVSNIACRPEEISRPEELLMNPWSFIENGTERDQLAWNEAHSKYFSK